MANPTTNFGWVMPTSTDLVTDLPADFAVFGQGVDTTMADLKGGTTGQVLAKASNTDMDFTWTADASGIPATIIDAKGDLIAGTAADTAARLAVGTNGQILTADSTAATGLKWATPAGGGGKILQVVQATYSTATTSTSTSFSDSGLSATITPSSASSKVLVFVAQQLRGYRESTFQAVSFQLVRGASAILTYDYQASNGLLNLQAIGATTVSYNTNPAINYLDSPATTSATTYKTQIAVGSTANAGFARAQTDGNTSVIILMEVGA
jgi:hypothetical protein